MNVPDVRCGVQYLFDLIGKPKRDPAGKLKFCAIWENMHRVLANLWVPESDRPILCQALYLRHRLTGKVSPVPDKTDHNQEPGHSCPKTTPATCSMFSGRAPDADQLPDRYCYRDH